MARLYEGNKTDCLARGVSFQYTTVSGKSSRHDNRNGLLMFNVNVNQGRIIKHVKRQIIIK